MQGTKRIKTSDITNPVVLTAYMDAFKLGLDVEALLMERTGAPAKVCRSAMTRAFKRGIVTTDKPRIGFDYVTPAKYGYGFYLSCGRLGFGIVPKVLP